MKLNISITSASLSRPNHDERFKWASSIAGKRCPVESASFQQHSLLLTACGWCVWISTEQIMAINIAPHQKGIGLSKQNPLKQHIQSNGFKPMKQLVAKFLWFPHLLFFASKNETTTIALNWHLPNSFRIPILLQLSRSALWVSKWSGVLYSKNM